MRESGELWVEEVWAQYCLIGDFIITKGIKRVWGPVESIGQGISLIGSFVFLHRLSCVLCFVYLVLRVCEY